MTDQPRMFVRNATGLVRELSPFDAFNLVFAAILIPVGISQALGFGAASFPGANIALAFTIGTLLLLIGFGAVYIFFTIAMPRSGGDYVWVSRSLSPYLGFVVNVTLTFVFVNWVSFNFTTMTAFFAPAVGYVMNWSPEAIKWFDVPGNQFLLATILTILFTLIMIPGTKFVAKFMKIMFAIVWIGVAIWYVGLLITPQNMFAENFVQITGVEPSQIITLARESGFHLTPNINIRMTIFAVLWAFQNLSGFQWTGYFAGEVKNVRRTAITSILGGLLAGGALYALGALLVYKTVGFDFFSSLSFLGINAPDKMPKNILFILPALTKFLNLPYILKSYIVLSFLLSILWWTPAGFMLGTRNLFAWAFDNLAPKWVADVHPKFHTPVNATIVVGVFIELLNYLNVYGGLSNYLINIIAVMALAFIIVGLAATIFPYRRKDLYENAPEIVKKKVWGMPLMTITGIVTILSWSFVLISAFLVPQFGLEVTPTAMIEAFSIPILASIWYVTAVFIRKRQGIDINKVFSEIPPE